MVNQVTSFGVAADDPYAEVGEEGEDDEKEDGGHWDDCKRINQFITQGSGHKFKGVRKHGFTLLFLNVS